MTTSKPASPFVARRACPGCGSGRSKTLYCNGFSEPPLGPFLKDYYQHSIPAGIYQLDECLDCSLVFQRFVGSDALLAEIYGEWITYGIDGTYRAALADFRGSRDGHELMALSAYIGKPKLKVLDYGSGWGLWPIIASRLGHDAYAVEIAPEKAKWIGEQGVTLLADEDIPRHDFDVVNLEQTLEHMTEPRALLERLVPSLRGILKVAVPNAINVPAIVCDLRRGDVSSIMPVHPFEHINSFTAKSLGLLARSLGLTEVRPGLRDRYSFGLSGLPKAPVRCVKEVIRPMVMFNRKDSLYRWFHAL